MLQAQIKFFYQFNVFSDSELINFEYETPSSLPPALILESIMI